MITNEKATHFAAKWISAWNKHDIDAILEHYADDIEFTSPLIVNILNRPSGRVIGKAELRAYFSKGLAAYPDLKFELYHAFAGVNSIVLYYKSVKNLIASEVFIFNEQNMVQTCFCNYKES